MTLCLGDLHIFVLYYIVHKLCARDLAKTNLFCINYTNVTESRKTVPNHTFFVHYIYYCNMNSITFLHHYMEFNAQIIKIV